MKFCMILYRNKINFPISGYYSDTGSFFSYLEVSNFKKNYTFYPVLPSGIYLLKVNKRNTKARCEICSNLTIKIPERRYWRRSVAFIVNFEHVSHLVLAFLLLTLDM